MRALSPKMQTAIEHFRQNGQFAPRTHAATVKALVKRGYVICDESGHYTGGDKLQESPSPIVEMIGEPRVNKLAVQWIDRSMFQPTTDWGQPDYTFWNRARWGRAQGLELSGLFLKPLASKIAAWTLGMPPVFKFDNAKTQTAAADWFNQHHADVLRAFEEAVGLGDAYLVVNSDLSVTVLPPNVVVPIVDENDYSRIIGWRITEVHPHPTRTMDTMKIVDEYTEKERVRKIYKNDVLQRTERYPNLIGINPVIHIPNNPGSDERFGHPEGEALLSAFQQYGTIFAAAIAGNKKQGRPTPVIEKMGTDQQLDAFWERFGTQKTRTLEDGTTETYWEMAFDSDNVITLGGDAVFKWAAPGSFGQDVQTLLGLLFYLVLQHTEVPEFIWGNAISSSHASAEAQMPPFVKFIEKKQGQCRRWLLELARIVVGYISLWERGVRPEDTIGVQWASLTQEDGRLTLDAIKLALDKGLIDEETALGLMPIDIENPREVLKKAREEMAAKQDEYDRRQEDMLQRLGTQQSEDVDATPDEGEEAEMPAPDSDVDEIWTKALTETEHV